jgi:hypothetical protein
METKKAFCENKNCIYYAEVNFYSDIKEYKKKFKSMSSFPFEDGEAKTWFRLIHRCVACAYYMAIDLSIPKNIRDKDI